MITSVTCIQYVLRALGILVSINNHLPINIPFKISGEGFIRDTPLLETLQRHRCSEQLVLHLAVKMCVMGLGV